MAHSLFVRFFALCTAIAALSIAVTAWLASQATTGSISQEQGEALATDATLYDQLLGYAADHRDWSGVADTARALAAGSGRRIALTTRDGVPLVDTGGPDAPPLPVRPKAIVDPLNVDQVLKPDAPADAVDPRAVGPFRLTPDEAERLRHLADAIADCTGVGVVLEPGGRPVLSPPIDPGPKYAVDCPAHSAKVLTAPTETEQAASRELRSLLLDCLNRVRPDARVDPRWTEPAVLRWWLRPPPPGTAPEVAGCLSGARRAQLAPHVAPPALLFLTAPTGVERPGVDLSSAGATRVALTGFAVLALAGFASWLVASRLVRPIRAVTAAARRMGAGDRFARVTGPARGEVGDLAGAFNAMSDRLAEAERQRQALVSDVAHELRTPLATVTGWLEAVQDGVATIDPQLLAILLSESHVLRTLVDDLHDLAQADAGALRLHPEPLDAAEVVEQVVAAHHADGVPLVARTSGRLELTADPVRLRQAVRNLVTNALRYTPPGGTVTVSGKREGSDVVIEVADTGTGIAPDDLPHVFDRFWRADKSRSRATGGSGLGLAITKYLVEAHGGTVEVTSTVGKGSTFRLRLPA
ncbi:ATP-binding protein [Saccharothrix sp.]|uniref:sensor histidine kinase n=1 Tax=Saccharothrix sp. TaxID=1873460 RepID=UPI0028127D80|nr:ATP-binding protein [Saccharothrix sp.]